MKNVLTSNRIVCHLAFFVFAAVVGWGRADVTIETARLRLTLGDDAVVKSRRLLPSGEEMVEPKDAIPFVTVTQDRFYHNEIKLAYPSGQVTCRANAVRRAGDMLRVGFEQMPYDALIRVQETPAYVCFELVDFEIHGQAYGPLQPMMPLVKTLRILQLPVRPRANFGAWLNVMWDERAAVALLAPDAFMAIGAEERNGYRLFAADLSRDLKLKGGKAVLMGGAGKDDFLSCLDKMEVDFDLPRGVQDRAREVFNRSVFWTADVTPVNVDEQIACARRAGFSMMLIYHTALCPNPGDYPQGEIGDYDLRPEYVNGLDSLRTMLDKIKAAGIHPGLHLLHPFIGFKSRWYVTPVADHRLLLKKHFTVARDAGVSGGDLYVEENPQTCPTAPMARRRRISAGII